MSSQPSWQQAPDADEAPKKNDSRNSLADQGQDRRSSRDAAEIPRNLSNGHFRKLGQLEYDKARRELREKIFAILVALSWTLLVDHLSGESGNERRRSPGSFCIRVIFAPLCWGVSYILAWFLSIRLPQVRFEQFTLLAAEVTAFMWRDAYRAIFWEVVHFESTERLTLEFVVGTTSLSVFSIMVLGVTRRLRQKESRRNSVAESSLDSSDSSLNLRLTNSEELRTERVTDAMLDIELDAVCLAIGFAVFSTFNEAFLGPTYRKLIEERTWESSGHVEWYWLVAAGVSFLGGLWLLILEKTNVPEKTARFLVSRQAFGFTVGFLYDMAFSLSWIPNFPQVIGGDGSEVVFGSILYPAFMILAGSALVAILRTHTTIISDSHQHDSTLIKHTRFVLVLAVQLCVALSFEGLFERIFRSFFDEMTEHGLTHPSFLQAMAASLIYVVFSCGPGAGRAEDAIEVAKGGAGRAEDVIEAAM